MKNFILPITLLFLLAMHARCKTFKLQETCQVPSDVDVLTVGKNFSQSIPRENTTKATKVNKYLNLINVLDL